MLLAFGVYAAVTTMAENREAVERRQADRRDEDPLEGRRRSNAMYGAICSTSGGCILLLLGTRSQAQRNGYHF